MKKYWARCENNEGDNVVLIIKCENKESAICELKELYQIKRVIEIQNTPFRDKENVQISSRLGSLSSPSLAKEYMFYDVKKNNTDYVPI